MVCASFPDRLWRVGFSLRLSVDEVEDDENLLAGNTLGGWVEALEAGIHLANELIVSVTVLEATLDAVVIHLGDKRLELFLREQAISVGIS